MEIKVIALVVFIGLMITLAEGVKLECNRPHEHYACGSACQNRCDTLGETCTILNIKCNDACYCDKGYARDSKDVCIPEKECPPKPIKPNCTNPYEHYECGSACQTECATLGETCPVVNIRCNDACYCDEGYARDVKGVCIPTKKCPPKHKKYCKKANEDFQCGNYCGKTCDTVNAPCPKGQMCTFACFCNEGYARDDNGDCIPKEKCLLIPTKPNCTNPHEHYECGSACQTECATLGEICPIVNVRCNDACYCDEGYARNEKGLCVPKKKCPPKHTKYCKKANEDLQCGNYCGKTCDTVDAPCPKVPMCTFACFCNEGYARDDNGDCIPKEKCPLRPKLNCTNPHEHYECGLPCQTECATLGEKCPAQNIKCNDACFCDKGYARNKDGVCIPEKDCPPKNSCSNE